MHQWNVDQYIGQKSWQHVHEQIEEFPQRRLCLVLLHQRVVLGIIPNKKPVRRSFIRYLRRWEIHSIKGVSACTSTDDYFAIRGKRCVDGIWPHCVEELL